MSLTDPHIIRAAILSRLAARPGGDDEMYPTPGTTHRPRLEAMATEGLVRLDPDGTVHMTSAGWHALGAARQTRVWCLAVTEHCQRQGPLDADGIRGLILEHASTEQAFRRLAAAGHPAAAETMLAEATLLKARLAVLSGVPVRRMDDVAVLLHAETTAAQLEANPPAAVHPPSAAAAAQFLLAAD